MTTKDQKLTILEGFPLWAMVANLMVKVAIIALIIVNAVDHSHAAQQITPPAPSKVQATVKNVDPAKNLLVIKIEGRKTSLTITPATKISMTDGKSLALGDLKKGDEVKVAWADSSGRLIADEVTVILPAQYKEKKKNGAKGQGKNKN